MLTMRIQLLILSVSCFFVVAKVVQSGIAAVCCVCCSHGKYARIAVQDDDDGDTDEDESEGEEGRFLESP